MMKKWILWAAAALIVIGCMIGGISMQMLDWDFMRLDTEKGEWKEEQFAAGEIEKIIVSGASLPVLVETSEDDTIHVLVYITETKNVRAAKQDNVLNIYAQETFNKHILFQMFGGLKSIWNGIVVQIPGSYAGSVELKNDNGSVTASELKISGDLSAVNENGRISMENVSARSVSAENSNGSVHLEYVTTVEEVKTKNSNGSTWIEGAAAKTAEFSGSNGRVALEEVSASESLKAQNNNGSIRIEEVSSPFISLTNSNGSVKGNINGRRADYRVASNTKNGFCNLVSNADVSRPYLLEVENDNGSTRIEFSEN